jgi:hypothetical protein
MKPMRCILPAALLVAVACSDSVTIDTRPVDRIVLLDEVGGSWDITQAVLRYGFEPDRFRFGLGAFAIPPLVLPPMARAGDPAFPASDSAFSVAAVSFRGLDRAYGRDEMLTYQVINDTLAARAVAVVYEPAAGGYAGYLRTTDGTGLTLSASGWLYDDRTVFFDYESGSLWYAFPDSPVLTCINGAFLGNELASFAVSREQWPQWLSSHPATLVLWLPVR